MTLANREELTNICVFLQNCCSQAYAVIVSQTLQNQRGVGGCNIDTTKAEMTMDNKDK